MKNKLYFLVYICYLIVSCNHSKIEYKRYKAIAVDIGVPIPIDSNCFLIITQDSSLFNMIMSFNNGNDVRVDTIENTPYNLKIILYSTNKLKSKVILREVEYENGSSIIAYYYDNGLLQKIGNLDIYSDCDTCETLSYNINAISITKAKNIITFNFTERLKHKGDTARIFNKNEFSYNYNLNTKTLIPKIRF